jgi:hypothetical protein
MFLLFLLAYSLCTGHIAPWPLSICWFIGFCSAHIMTAIKENDH